MSAGCMTMLLDLPAGGHLLRQRRGNLPGQALVPAGVFGRGQRFRSSRFSLWGIYTLTGPIALMTVFADDPLREFPDPRPSGAYGFAAGMLLQFDLRPGRQDLGHERRQAAATSERDPVTPGPLNEQTGHLCPSGLIPRQRGWHRRDVTGESHPVM